MSREAKNKYLLQEDIQYVAFNLIRAKNGRHEVKIRDVEYVQYSVVNNRSLK